MARQASSQQGFGSRPVCQHCFAPVQLCRPWSKQRLDSSRLWPEGMVGRVCSTQSKTVWHKEKFCEPTVAHWPGWEWEAGTGGLISTGRSHQKISQRNRTQESWIFPPLPCHEIIAEERLNIVLLLIYISKKPENTDTGRNYGFQL